MTLYQRFAIYFGAALKLDACSYTILTMDSRVISQGCDPSGLDSCWSVREFVGSTTSRLIEVRFCGRLYRRCSHLS